MADKITRRTFVRKSAGIGAVSVLGGSLFSAAGCGNAEGPEPEAATPDAVDIGVAGGGADQEKGALAVRAVELLGGIKRFVPSGSRVCLLPNTQIARPGTFTKPEILRVVIGMCREAGAEAVTCLSWLQQKHWDATGLGKAVEEAGGTLKLVAMKDPSLYRKVPIPKGVALKEARIMKAFFEHDVFINLPITKDHAGNRFTGTMKNLMGLNMQETNMEFHTGNFKDDDILHLDQCIADLNTVITPALCIVDATEFIITNGPFGPGDILRPMKVVAGTDRVAIDAYCAGLWGLEPREIVMIDRGFKHGLGEIDLEKKKIRETTL